jgi:hypothetical protein
MPIRTVFTTLTEFQFMEFKAIVDRVQWALREKGTYISIHIHVQNICMHVHICI